MVIINQKRAHERILYEEYLRSMTVQQASSQKMLFPLQLSFSKTEIQLLTELRTSLESMGFIFDAIQDDAVVISGIPLTVAESQIALVVDELLSDLQHGIPASSFCQNDTIAKSIAKSLAVKTGTYLTEKEQENLVHNLFACKEPNVSPSQKPTFITMSVSDIDKKFST